MSNYDASAERQKARLAGWRAYQVRTPAGGDGSGSFGIALQWADSPREALTRFIAESVFRAEIRQALDIETTADGGAEVEFRGVRYWIAGDKS